MTSAIEVIRAQEARARAYFEAHKQPIATCEVGAQVAYYNYSPFYGQIGEVWNVTADRDPRQPERIVMRPPVGHGLDADSDGLPRVFSSLPDTFVIPAHRAARLEFQRYVWNGDTPPALPDYPTPEFEVADWNGDRYDNRDGAKIVRLIFSIPHADDSPALLDPIVESLARGLVASEGIAPVVYQSGDEYDSDLAANTIIYAASGLTIHLMIRFQYGSD